MKKRFFLWIGILGFAIAAGSGNVHATPLGDPVEKAKLPNDEWAFEKKDTTGSPAAIMYVKKTGQAVNLRLHTYEVPISAKAFLEQVRIKISEKPDYAGADIRTVTSKKSGGKVWDCFDITRKDEISQEICARKSDPSVVVMAIYTGAGDLYKHYYSEYSDWLKKSPSWLGK